MLVRTTMEQAEHFVHELQKYTLHATMGVSRETGAHKASGRFYSGSVPARKVCCLRRSSCIRSFPPSTIA